MEPLNPNYPALSEFFTLFNFKDEASRAHALAALLGLSLPARYARHIPEFLFQGPPASGKTTFMHSLHFFEFGDSRSFLRVRAGLAFTLPNAITNGSDPGDLAPVRPVSGESGRGIVSVVNSKPTLSSQFVWDLRNAITDANSGLECPHLIFCEQNAAFDHTQLDHGLLIQMENVPRGDVHPIDFIREHRIDLAIDIGHMFTVWGAAFHPYVDEDRIANAGLPEKAAKFLGAMHYILKFAGVPGFLGNRDLRLPLDPY